MRSIRERLYDVEGKHCSLRLLEDSEGFTVEDVILGEDEEQPRRAYFFPKKTSSPIRPDVAAWEVFEELAEKID